MRFLGIAVMASAAIVLGAHGPKSHAWTGTLDALSVAWRNEVENRPPLCWRASSAMGAFEGRVRAQHLEGLVDDQQVVRAEREEGRETIVCQ